MSASAWRDLGATPQRRHGFVWFLLASTTVLLALLGTLAAAAVWKACFA